MQIGADWEKNCWIPPRSLKKFSVCEDCLTGKLTEMRADLEDCQAEAPLGRLGLWEKITPTCEASNRVRETLGAKVRCGWKAGETQKSTQVQEQMSKLCISAHGCVQAHVSGILSETAW